MTQNGNNLMKNNLDCRQTCQYQQHDQLCLRSCPPSATALPHLQVKLWYASAQVRKRIQHTLYLTRHCLECLIQPEFVTVAGARHIKWQTLSAWAMHSSSELVLEGEIFGPALQLFTGLTSWRRWGGRASARSHDGVPPVHAQHSPSDVAVGKQSDGGLAHISCFASPLHQQLVSYG